MALIGTCLSIISYPIYLHYLGYHRYGLWLVLSVIVSVGGIGKSWDTVGVMKLVAEDHGRWDWEGVKNLYQCWMRHQLAIGLMFLGAVIFAPTLYLGWF